MALTWTSSQESSAQIHYNKNNNNITEQDWMNKNWTKLYDHNDDNVYVMFKNMNIKSDWYEYMMF